MYKNRAEAGQKLAAILAPTYQNSDAIVLGIPRGGVVVADQIARLLHLRLDLIIPRKIGAPGNPELAIGAVALSHAIINQRIVRELEISKEYIERESQNQIEEIKRRRSMYLGDRQPLALQDATVIIADDGLATGYTALAAVDAVKKEKPKKVILTVPVAPRETYENLKQEVDELICPLIPEFFISVGQFYEEFKQTSDSEVIAIINTYR